MEAGERQELVRGFLRRFERAGCATEEEGMVLLDCPQADSRLGTCQNGNRIDGGVHASC